MDDRKHTLFITAVFLTGIMARILFLWSQPMLEDDYLFVVSAENYMERGQIGPSMIHHPYLRNILIYLSTKTLGKGPLGVYGPSLIAGILSVLILYLLSTEITKDRSVSLLAMFFLAIDPLHISFSRQAIQETTTLFFILLGLYLFFIFLKNNKTLFLTLSGISFGLGAASKWQALFPLLYCIVYLIISCKKDSIRYISHLTILPFTVYLMTFIPWFLRGYDIFEWINLQKQLYYLNKVLVNPVEEAIRNPGKPVLWFIVPTGYGMFTYAKNEPNVMIAIGNPLTWLLTVPGIIYLILSQERRKYLPIIMLFLISYIPLILASFNRDIYVLSAVSVIPFGFMAAALLIKKIGLRSQLIPAVYILLLLTISVLLYPLAIGKALDFSYLKFIVEQYNPHTGVDLR